jgi:hypothetical protein
MSQLQTNIKTFLSIDTDLKKLQDQSRLLREKKRELNISIINDIQQKHKNIDKLKINVDNRSIKFSNVTQYQPLSLTYIEECLEKCIDEEDSIVYILDLIKSSRKRQTTREIKINNI